MKDEWHHLYHSGPHCYSLYADVAQSGTGAHTQWMIPGFEPIFADYWRALPMKGMWNSEKSVDREYKPALDALRAIDKELLTRALLSVVDRGCALMIGATRDHGAISLILLDGNDRHKLYPKDVQELHQALTDLIDSLGETAAPAVRTKAKR